MDQNLPKIPVIYLRYTQDIPGMYLGYTWDIHERDIPHVGKFSILIDSVSEWMSDMPGSRDAYASKNLIKLKTI